MSDIDLKSIIRDVPDFPKPGILFKDITPLLKHPAALKNALDALAEPFFNAGITAVAGMESRGFIFGVPVAERLGVGFVPVRKPGKLPAETVSEEFALEYGTDTLEIHKDALGPEDKVLVIDDLLATGGTAAATISLVEKLGAAVVGLGFVIELAFLDGRSKLGDIMVHRLITY
ncbi:MAG: adenine phosphoribosyltransferase [Deltaproteobacteria bacterium]|nr:adenine phosphoribosyltransferase [Deltaproteobacteria bacterium]MBN2673457.1 adenine phosphoribosyltransferase [Deltaproteobacteria bacterium]